MSKLHYMPYPYLHTACQVEVEATSGDIVFPARRTGRLRRRDGQGTIDVTDKTKEVACLKCIASGSYKRRQAHEQIPARG